MESGGAAPHDEYWLQKWIAIAETIGIGRNELLNSYYIDEFLTVLDAYNELHSYDSEEVHEVSTETFFKELGGGETI